MLDRRTEFSYLNMKLDLNVDCKAIFTWINNIPPPSFLLQILSGEKPSDRASKMKWAPKYGLVGRY